MTQPLTILALALLLLIAPVAAQPALTLPNTTTYEALPNGKFEGAAPSGIGNYFHFVDTATTVAVADATHGQSINLAPAGAIAADTNADDNVLGRLSVRPYQGTQFKAIQQFSFHALIPNTLERTHNLAVYILVDTDNDGTTDGCFTTRPEWMNIQHQPTWRKFEAAHRSFAWSLPGGCGAGAPTGSQALSLWQANPLYANAVVRSIGIQSEVDFNKRAEAWPADQPVYIDDASLVVNDEPGVGPLGYHAQFSFTPPLQQAANAAGVEAFDLSTGSVRVLVQLYDNLGRPKDFRNGVDTDGTSARARLVLNGAKDSYLSGATTQYKATGVINPARQNEATFTLPAADLLHLQQAVTQWEMHVESRYESFPAGGSTFPYAFAFYNKQANAQFAARQPALADALDDLPSMVNAVLKPVKLTLTGAPATIQSGAAFGLATAVLDEANRPIKTQSYTVALAKSEGPQAGQLDASPSKATVNGYANFTNVKLHLVGDYKLQTSVDATGLQNKTANITVTPGALAGVGIVNAQEKHVGDVSVLADDQPTYRAMGYDAAGNKIGLVAAKWTLTGAIGSIAPSDTHATPASSVIFTPSTAGTGKLAIKHVDAAGKEYTDETGVLRVVAGALHHLEIDGGETRAIGANDLSPLTFTVTGRDQDNNAVSVPSSLAITWSIADFDANTPPQNGGSFNGNVLTPSGTVGNYTVRASASDTSGVLGDTMKLTITRGTIRSLLITSPAATRTAATPPAVPASQTFAAVARDGASNAVPTFNAENDATWTISPSNGGTFTKNVLAPSNRADVYTVTARLKSDPSIVAHQTFTIKAGPWSTFEIAGGDRSASVSAGSIGFSVLGRDAAGNGNGSIHSADDLTWSVGNGLGTFNKNVLTLSGSLGTGAVRAVHKTDSGKAAEILLTVRQQGLATIQIVEQDLNQKVGQLKPVDLLVTAKDEDGQPISVDAANGVVWSLSSSHGGTFTKNRLVPGEKAGSYTITAVLASKPSVSDTAVLTIGPGSVASLDIQGGDIVQTIGATKPVTLVAHGLDARGNVADTAPVVDWSLSDVQAGTFSGNVLVSGEKLGTFVLTGALHANPQIRDTVKLTLVGPTSGPQPADQVETVKPGQTHYIEYVLPEDTTSARVEFLDASGAVVATVNLTKSIKEGYSVWTGSVVLEKEGTYERRLFYETSSGQQQSVAEAPLKVEQTHAKKNTPGPGVFLVLAALGAGIVLARRRSA